MQSTLPALAPIEMVMPQGPQLWMNIINWAIVAAFFIYVLNHWRKGGGSIGIWFLFGGALCTLNEPIVDVLGKCWFPAIDSWVLFEAWNISIPHYMAPVYIWYVGGQAFFAYRMFEKGVTMRRVFGLYAAAAAVNVVLEVPGLMLGMYSYHGNQPLVFFKFPLWWTFCNALMPMMMAGVVFHFDSLLQGARRVLIVPLAWMAAAASNALIAAPIWVALNAEASTMALTHAAAAVSFCLGLLVCYGLATVVAVDAPVVKNRRQMI